MTAILRSCACGKVKGRYLNELDAETNGEGHCIGIDNYTLKEATNLLDQAIEQGATIKQGLRPMFMIWCWAMPHEGTANPTTKVNKDL
jgi:hypothetical protein